MSELRSNVDARGPLELRRLLAGRQLVVVGGSGFLGKVWWVLLLARFPELERLHLVLRVRGGQTAEERFWKSIATSECLTPLREQHGDGFTAFLRDKIRPVAGDVVQPFCGLDADFRDSLRGQVAAVVNVAGVVEFDPPLDVALEGNAFGVQNLVALARDLNDCAFVHTSTSFVAGSQTGFVEELDPREHPFPRAGDLDRAHWDPDREIAECLDIIEQAKHRANDAFRRSQFLADAKKNLREANEPGHGAALDEEVERVRRKFVEAQLAELGMERARYWGWANTYTYTKSIGEQIAASSGLPVTIVRPAIVESSIQFPFPGWVEGINTSAPLIYAIREGQTQLPGSDHILDFIPVDMVATGILLALGEVLDRTHKPVYQFASGDVNPISMSRMFELSGLYKRSYWKRTQREGPLLSTLQAHVEGAIFSTERFEKVGPKAVSRGAKWLSEALSGAAIGPVAPLLGPTAKKLAKFGRTQEKIHSLLMQFAPFTAEFDYVFRCDNTRAAFARLSEGERALLLWEPEKIDWRHWFLDIHCAGLEVRVFPEIEERLKKEVRAPRHHETLSTLLDEMVARFDLGVALQRTEEDGFSRISYRQWGERALACAARLEALGVRPGDRVVLAGDNHPAWPIAFFGIIKAGATVVPLEAAIEPEIAARLVGASGARLFIGDAKVRARVATSLPREVSFLELLAAAEPGTPAVAKAVAPSDIAALIYTSGTTGNPKGVMLSHHNLTNLIASLAPLFPLSRGDRVLSVLPLHHTFELACGLLLPLSRGARIIYLDELNAERLEHGLKEGRVTAMIGVPALWEALERKVMKKVAARGPLASRVFDYAVELNRSLGKSLGVDAGKLLFGPVHEGLGGHLRLLVSGGAALPESTHELFSGVGLHLAEGYGLTEASPVLSVSRSGPKERSGHVGKAIPGVEISIFEPDETGVGEVIARGPNVMVGYADNPDATRQVIDTDGWLHTGDLGKLDRKGNLQLVGRAKDTIVSSSGENVYPDDVEARLGKLLHVKELAIFGLGDGRGGERVACVAVPAEDDSKSVTERRRLAKQSLDEAFAKLPSVMRPTLTALIDEELPRTATKKVKRKELEAMVERVAPESVRPARLPPTDVKDIGADVTLRSVATIARRKPASLSVHSSLRGDLGFDSLMLLELLVTLETQAQRTVDADRLNRCETVGDVMELVRETVGRSAAVRSPQDVEKDEETEIELPQALRDAAMSWMGRAQHGFYAQVMKTKVTGRAFIPHNRSTLVVANHASHLDMGLIKYGLGKYGDDLVSLAAQDYFFEGKWRKAYFQNFTNLVAVSRSGSLRQSLRQAGSLIEEGRTLLVFPEGTRSPDGAMREFKPIAAHLALQYNVDILPIWVEGTFAALPKGATVVRRRKLEVRIGPPLAIDELRRLLTSASASELTRAVSRIVERAVSELSQGRVLDLGTLDVEPYIPKHAPSPVAPRSIDGLMEDLEARFKKGTVKGTHWFYFALGEKERWSLQLTPDSCRFERGKSVSTADCVLKTSPEMFQRIVLEAYTPTTGEFFSGVVKTNNPKLLKTFQRAFDLSEPTS